MHHPMLHQVDVDAEAERVYEAIATQEGLSSFWTRQAQATGEVGSTAVFDFPDAPVSLKMRVDALEPGKRVEWRCLGDFPGWAETTVTWELSDAEGGGTTVLFRHAGWAEGHDEREWASVNWVWGQVVARLKGHAESGEPQPFFP